MRFIRSSATLILVVIIVLVSIWYQVTERGKSDHIIQGYSEQGYEVPVDLLAVCAQRSMSAVYVRGLRSDFHSAAFVECLDAAGYRILHVGR